MVAGGGILGTWHTLELVEAGFEVDHLEAEAAPTGASVRNFGLVWVSGRRTGTELDVALRARRRWQEIGAAVPGIGFRTTGSLSVACTGPEREVMQEFAEHPDAAARRMTFLTPSEVRATNPAVRGDIEGALHCTEDAVVEPRLVLGALREHLVVKAPDRYRFHAHRRVVTVEPRALVDTTGTRWEADVVVVATGAAYDHLLGTGAQSPRLRASGCRCSRRRRSEQLLTTSVADADTLRYYPAYEVAALGRLGRQAPSPPNTISSCCWCSAPTVA